MKLYIYTGICGMLLLLCVQAKAQSNKGVNSLYSAFAIGDLEERDYSRNFGLGSAGIARPSLFYLNELNPASYSAIPQQNFMFDVALQGRSVTYTGDGLNQNALDGNLKRLAVGFKANKRWGIAAGLTPYSSVDYKFLNQRYIEGSGVPISSTTEGTGGINRVYLSNGVRLTDNFSAGVSSAFLFGPVNTTENLGGDTVSTVDKRYAYNLNFTTGIQYQGKIKDWQVGLGATYRFKTDMRFQHNIEVINSSEQVLYSEELDKLKYTLPEQYGIGLSLGKGNITLVADYKKQLWSGLNPGENNYRLVDAERYAGGLEYAFRKHYYNGVAEHLVLQAGFAYNKSYLSLQGNQIKDISGTAGVSIPNRNGALRYYLGVEVGQRGTLANDLIRENYVNFVLHFSFKDIWFIRRIYE
ncbi:hypothetical protein [Chitinophaga japonensis]|nr:hypothetical protein [Chitinophaga japonensis]